MALPVSAAERTMERSVRQVCSKNFAHRDLSGIRQRSVDNIFEGYTDKKELSRTNLSKIYTAYRSNTGAKGNRKVILKRTKRFPRSEGYDELKVLTFMQGRHAGIPKLVEWARSTKHVYMVLEYEKGMDLLSLVETSGYKLDMRIVKSIVVQLLDILMVSHMMGVVHGDIKLENVVYNKDTGKVTLIDWGFAYFKDNAPTAMGGSVPYTAPELFEYNRHGESNDIWSLGVLIYSLCTGNFPGGDDDEDEDEDDDDIYAVDLGDLKNKRLVAFLGRIFTHYRHRASAFELLCDPWILSR